MNSSSRNRIEKSGFFLEEIDTSKHMPDFDCGDADLNDYFINDSARYRTSLMTRTYAFYVTDGDDVSVVALVDFCNDALARNILPNASKRRIHHNKRGYKTFPAVKITRLGVDVSAHGKHIGSMLLDVIKEFFITDNRCGCRFLTVDAYREAIPFYQKNGFVLAQIEEDDESRQSSTVPMFFDLMRVVSA